MASRTWLDKKLEELQREYAEAGMNFKGNYKNLKQIEIKSRQMVIEMEIVNMQRKHKRPKIANAKLIDHLLQ